MITIFIMRAAALALLALTVWLVWRGHKNSIQAMRDKELARETQCSDAARKAASRRLRLMREEARWQNILIEAGWQGPREITKPISQKGVLR